MCPMGTPFVDTSIIIIAHTVLVHDARWLSIEQMAAIVAIHEKKNLLVKLLSKLYVYFLNHE